MSDFDVKEKRFEEDIESYLINCGGYSKGNPASFNRYSGLDRTAGGSRVQNREMKSEKFGKRVYL